MLFRLEGLQLQDDIKLQIKNLKSFNVDNLNSWIKKFYGSGNIIFVISGKFTKNSVINDRLYTFLVIVWGLYGFAAMLSNKNKNISYNLLDLVAKNFYGLYIFFLIKSLS